jgi:hypothetical protein
MHTDEILPVTRTEVGYTRRQDAIVGHDSNEFVGLSSGGRSIVDGRKRYKGVDPLGYITERVYQNPIETIDIHVEEPPDLKHERDAFERGELVELKDYVEGTPFGTMLEYQAKTTKSVFERISDRYGELNLTPPSYFNSITKIPGMRYNGRSVYSVSSTIPEEWADMRISELYLCMALMGSTDPDKIMRMNGDVSKAIGFNVKQLYHEGIMPFLESDIPSEIICGMSHYSYLQNYVLFPLDNQHYGVSVVDVSSSSDIEPEQRSIDRYARVLNRTAGQNMRTWLFPPNLIGDLVAMRNFPHEHYTALESAVVHAFEYLRKEVFRAGLELPGFLDSSGLYKTIRENFWKGFVSKKHSFLDAPAIDEVLGDIEHDEFVERFETLKEDVKKDREKYVPRGFNPDVFLCLHGANVPK